MMNANNFSFQNADIRKIDRSQLVNRESIVIDHKLPQNQRLVEFCR